MKNNAVKWSNLANPVQDTYNLIAVIMCNILVWQANPAKAHSTLVTSNTKLTTNQNHSEPNEIRNF